MNQEKATWLIAGTTLVLCASALVPLGGGDNPLIPTPVHQFLLWLLTPYGPLLFLPAAYGLSLHLLWDRRSFGRAVLGFSLLVALLSVVWFVASWADGVSYPGARFTRGVAVENAVGLVVATVLALVGVVRSSRSHSAAAHLVTFVMLAWCAFPLLGRVDL